MGFYDEGYDVRRPKRKSGSWLSSFVSAIIGATIVLIVVSISNGGNWFSSDEGTSVLGPGADSSADSGPVVQQPLQVDVTSGITDLVDEVSNAIVGVINIQQHQGHDFFSQQTENVDQGVGSGIIFNVDGDVAHIVTNYHVIHQSDEIEVSLANGERVPAIEIGSDPLMDLAVLEMDAEHVDVVAEFGDSDTLRVGEPAIAIGNPLGLDFSRTVTQGIISGTDRSIEVQSADQEMGTWEMSVIQTDAAINVGNSGGALLNVHGQVIGINSLKIAQQGQAIMGGAVPVEGMGFAIPISDAIPVIEQLVQNGEVQRPLLGILMRDVGVYDPRLLEDAVGFPRDIRHGVVIQQVEPGSPAAEAGIQPGDIIIEINGEELENGTELRQFLYKETQIGETITVRYFRDGLPNEVEVELFDSM